MSNIGIKSIRGFIYLHNRQTDRQTEPNNLRLMFVDNIRLVRLRGTETPVTVPVTDTPNQIRHDTSIKKSIPADNNLNKTPDNNKPQPLQRKLMPVQGGVKPMKMSDIKPIASPREIKKK